MSGANEDVPPWCDFFSGRAGRLGVRLPSEELAWSCARVAEVELSHAVFSEVHAVATCFHRGTHADELAHKGLADSDRALREHNPTVAVLDPTHRLAGVVFQGGGHFREAPLTGLVTAGGNRQAQGFVRLFVIGCASPRIELTLAIEHVAEAAIAEDFRFQRAMKPFLLAGWPGLLQAGGRRPKKPQADDQLSLMPDTGSTLRLKFLVLLTQLEASWGSDQREGPVEP